MLVGLLAVYHISMQRKWQEPHRVFAYDIGFYYAYLPAFFVQGNLRLEKLDPTALPKDHWEFPQGPMGYRFTKMTCGLALLYLPFFLVAHLLAPVLGYAPNGYTVPYAFALVASGWVYLVLGLGWMARWLRPYGSPLQVAAAVVLIGLGNNLYHYATEEGGMSHTYLFALVALLALQVERFWQAPGVRAALVVGLVWGLCVLIRPTHLLLGLWVGLLGVTSWRQLGERLHWWLQRTHVLLVVGVGGLLACSLQLIYWRHVTGEWVFYSYTDERFFWLDPKLWQVLVSGRKGWLLYSPTLVLAVVGLALLRRTAPAYSRVLPALVVLWLYLLSCWWVWWFGGSLGMRPMIDLYALLGLPLVALFGYISTRRRWVQFVFGGVAVGLLYLNLHISFHYRYGRLHWDSMTYRAYFYAVARRNPDPKVMESLLEHPDYNKAKAGER